MPSQLSHSLISFTRSYSADFMVVRVSAFLHTIVLLLYLPRCSIALFACSSEGSYVDTALCFDLLEVVLLGNPVFRYPQPVDPNLY